MPVIKVSDRGENDRPVLGSDEKVRHETNAAWYGGDQKSLGEGKVYITEKQIVWLSNENKELGLSLDYHSLTMHAVCKATDHFPKECVYGQIGYDGDDFYLVPEDPHDVEYVYKNICDCSALNPDPENQEEAESELFTSENLNRPTTQGLENGMNGLDLSAEEKNKSE
mmetsp:Transcript_8672/g.16000  ORF Transcript_8672/g.16000 Transcript_8672/m.16000 type:complete len:168 (-) Transcript_8672:14-517(-)